MQEAFLRRGRDRNAGAAAEDDRLAHLMIPGAEGQRLALEAFELELIGQQELLQLLRLGLVRAHSESASARTPSHVVALGGLALGERGSAFCKCMAPDSV